MSPCEASPESKTLMLHRVRKLLKRGSFSSVEELTQKVLAFIDYYNQTMAKPFKWTYQGKALVA